MSSIIIESTRKDGSKFRPSDWIERLSDNLGTFKSDRRLHYADECKPVYINGEKCLVISKSLEASNQRAFIYIMNFASSNDLRCNSSKTQADK